MRLEERLDSLRAADATLGRDDDPERAAAVKLVCHALGLKTAEVVARAAEIAGRRRLHEAEPALAPALRRFLAAGHKKDPQCRAKQALLEAMRALPNALDVRLARQALGTVQMEPVWGGRVDTAPGVRGTAAIALVEASVPDLLNDLAGLLADPEPVARALGVSAVAATGSPGAEAMLRLLVLKGDPEPEVTAGALRALLGTWPRRSHTFVADALEHGDARVREEAALALGESRAAEAAPALVAYAERAPEPGERRVACIALGLLRSDAANEVLLEMLATGLSRDARDALEGLAAQRHDEALRERVERAVDGRRDRALSEAFEDRFGY